MTGGVIEAPQVERRRYDREFDEAIREGCLTVEQAMARGNRQTYVKHLSTRFRLPEELALRVADNRAGLTDVLRAIGYIPGHTTPQNAADAPARRQFVALMLGLLALAGLLGIQQWQKQRDIGRRLEILQLAAPPIMDEGSVPLQAAAAQPTPTSIELDNHGRITKISARRPDDVLAALCSATLHGSCETMQVYPSIPPFPGRRLGLLTVPESGEPSQALPIQRDRRSGQWIAGTGLAPIISSREHEAISPAHRCEARDGSDCVTLSGSTE
jgi:hypothetical protein